MRETWYVLEDDSVADPSEVAPDEAGVLRHKSGAAVAMRSPDAPMTRGVDVGGTTKRQAEAEKPKTASNREMKAGAAKSYKTR